MNAPGIMTSVNDTQIHVYKISPPSSHQPYRLIFLSGSGTACPVYDFKPLWHFLEDRYEMAVVERPGYGWSGLTEYPRDIDTLLEETREALRQAGVKGPFIPVCHSLSGLEALYWTQKYPQEVSAVIGLDMSVPALYDSMEPPRFLTLTAKLVHLMNRFIANTMVKNHAVVKSGLLSKEEQEAMRRVVSRQLLSKNVIDEVGYVKDNARRTAEGQRPSVPVLCFLSDDAGLRKQTPDWGKIHRAYFSGNDRASFVDLPCGHYVHCEAPGEIAGNMEQFLSALPSPTSTSSSRGAALS